MSDLPETAEIPLPSHGNQESLAVAPDNPNPDLIEQEIDNQIRRSIDEQAREEVEDTANSRQVETSDNNDNEDQVNNTAHNNDDNSDEDEENLEPNPGVFNRVFNRENLMRVFNQIIADPDIDQIFDEDMSDGESDYDDLEDAGFYTFQRHYVIIYRAGTLCQASINRYKTS